MILSQALLEIAKSSVSRRRERRCAFGTQRPDPNNPPPLVIWLVVVYILHHLEKRVFRVGRKLGFATCDKSTA